MKVVEGRRRRETGAERKARKRRTEGKEMEWEKIKEKTYRKETGRR